MIDVRNVRIAERRVELRKQQVRERWDSLRLRGRDALLSPAGSILRGVASGVLQTIAAIAVEEALKSTSTGGSRKTGATAKH